MKEIKEEKMRMIKGKIEIIVSNLMLYFGGAVIMLSPIILALIFIVKNPEIITESSNNEIIIIGGLMGIYSVVIILFILLSCLKDIVREWTLCNKIGKCSKCGKRTSEYELYISNLNPKKDLCWICKEKEDKKFTTHWIAHVD